MFLYSADLTISLTVRTEFVFFCLYHDKSEILSYSGSMAEGRFAERGMEKMLETGKPTRENRSWISAMLFLFGGGHQFIPVNPTT